METIGILIKKEALEKGKNENGNEWKRITAVFQADGILTYAVGIIDN